MVSVADIVYIDVLGRFGDLRALTPDQFVALLEDVAFIVERVQNHTTEQRRTLTFQVLARCIEAVADQRARSALTLTLNALIAAERLGVLKCCCSRLSRFFGCCAR